MSPFRTPSGAGEVLPQLRNLYNELARIEARTIELRSDATTAEIIGAYNQLRAALIRLTKEFRPRQVRP